jgi:lipopolysaccharide/colanic/teichoic acid biosynthesis glycosyltransferase
VYPAGKVEGAVTCTIIGKSGRVGAFVALLLLIVVAMVLLLSVICTCILQDESKSCYCHKVCVINDSIFLCSEFNHFGRNTTDFNGRLDAILR